MFPLFEKHWTVIRVNSEQWLILDLERAWEEYYGRTQRRKWKDLITIWTNRKYFQKSPLLFSCRYWTISENADDVIDTDTNRHESWLQRSLVSWWASMDWDSLFLCSHLLHWIHQKANNECTHFHYEVRMNKHVNSRRYKSTSRIINSILIEIIPLSVGLFRYVHPEEMAICEWSMMCTYCSSWSHFNLFWNWYFSDNFFLSF